MAGRASGLLAPATAPSILSVFLSSATRTRSRVATRIATHVASPQCSSLSRQFDLRGAGFRPRYRSSVVDPSEDPPDGEGQGFDGAASLFNDGDYYSCHDVLEEMWYGAEEPIRTLVHGILQCAVGLHHLFNQNHRGAMMELGEGLCKLRKMEFGEGPFLQFEREISEVLEFLYQTQKELAACTDDLCLAMDGSERSYQLLGSFAAGQALYKLEKDSTTGFPYIIFNPDGRYNVQNPVRVKIPTLHATEENLKACEYSAEGEAGRGRSTNLPTPATVGGRAPLDRSSPARATSVGTSPLLRQNSHVSAPCRINLLGMAPIGNDLTHPVAQVATHADSVYFTGMINEWQRAQLSTAMATGACHPLRREQGEALRDLPRESSAEGGGGEGGGGEGGAVGTCTTRCTTLGTGWVRELEWEGL